MIHLYLFWEFFQTGLFAFGGGLATLPFLSNMAARYGWFTQAELTNMLAVSEATPGPIGVNMATYCGMKTAGVPGACIATFGLVLPSILCMLLLASLLARYQESRTVRGALQVLRPVSVGLGGGGRLRWLSRQRCFPGACGQSVGWRRRCLSCCWRQISA